MGVFLCLTGYPIANFWLILIVWFVILFSWLITNWLERRQYFQKMDRTLEGLDQRYLLGELMPKSWHLEDKLYQGMIRKSNKAVIERIHQIEEEESDYKEYIEGWVHEIKAPITSISLICENRRKQGGPEYGTVGLENQKIENYVDMALYYARSEEVYKDYMIQETSLETVVYEVFSKNRQFLIEHQIQAEVDCQDKVYTDGKWISFLLNQMILNSVKYKSEHPLLKIYTRKTEKSVLLILEDNGIGIRKEELSRIFDKGFTGSNGRAHERATGMGLYICKKLSSKLGVDLHAESTWGKGTKMMIEFPISTYLSKM
ncbi:sensor histidine kinase [Hespellia stercorisuis]|uniref:histidine kinase n=1 Tax=Hespellia stercorisuis DSM 15480 TaxID=1121950 RepID=A0A1M6X608_9FIRM|nr:sensor histidine kinase [Hespellia stercorisuis]SHL01289.1 Signal transduction histidine kinase [Hespellia stercorisuis DSM 15480]